jgi:Na+/melibiose symporter-like transporter
LFFLIGTFNLLFDISNGAFIPLVIPRDKLIDGNSKIEASYATAQMGGPAIGGALVSIFTAPFAILITALTLLCSALLIRKTSVPEPPPVVIENRSVRGDIADGLSLVWRHKLMRPVILVSVGHNFFGWMFMSVYVLYMKRDLGISDFQVGLVFAAGGVGALLGTLATPGLNNRFGVGPVMIAGSLLFGIAGLIIPMAVLLPDIALPLVVICEFLQFLFLMPFFLNTVTLLQMQSPDALRGRVMSTRKFLTWGVQPFGSLMGGILGGLITVPWTLAVGEIGLLAVGVWFFTNPIRSMRVLPLLEENVDVVAA